LQHEGATAVACQHPALLARLQLAAGPMYAVMRGLKGRWGQVICFIVVAVRLRAMLAWAAHVQCHAGMGRTCAVTAGMTAGMGRTCAVTAGMTAGMGRTCAVTAQRQQRTSAVVALNSTPVACCMTCAHPFAARSDGLSGSVTCCGLRVPMHVRAQLSCWRGCIR
jgi:hypothetical protein